MRSDEAPRFDGVVIDTAANCRSIMSLEQYRAFQYEFGRKLPMWPATKDVKGIGGKSRAISEVTVQIPFLSLNLIIDVKFSILDDKTPSLLCNRDLIQNGLDISLQGAYLYIGERRQPLILDNFFFIYKWKSSSIPYFLYTENELRRIHRNFGHPSVGSTHKLLKRASKDPIEPDKRKQLEKIVEDCMVCRRNAPTPRIFKMTVGAEVLIFNHTVIVNTMFIDGKPVIHMFDAATHFSAASLLRNQTASEILRCIMNLWVLTYMGPPDHFAVDQG